MTKKIAFQITCLIVLLVSHFNLSYNFNEAWWHSAFGFCIILFTGYLIWGIPFFSVSGLRLSPPALAGSVVASICLVCISAYVSISIATPSHISIHLSSLKNYFHNAVYIVNEEIILGSMMLYFLCGRFKIRPLAASAFLAVMVAMAHYILYKYYFRHRGDLAVTTLLTLTLNVFVKNNLIIRFRHIGYAWALHFGWMVVMYGSIHIFDATQLEVNDFQKFDIYLGSAVVLIVSFFMALASLWLLFPPRFKNKRSKQKKDKDVFQHPDTVSLSQINAE